MLLQMGDAGNNMTNNGQIQKYNMLQNECDVGDMQ